MQSNQQMQSLSWSQHCFMQKAGLHSPGAALPRWTPLPVNAMQVTQKKSLQRPLSSGTAPGSKLNLHSQQPAAAPSPLHAVQVTSIRAPLAPHLGEHWQQPVLPCLPGITIALNNLLVALKQHF